MERIVDHHAVPEHHGRRQSRGIAPSRSQPGRQPPSPGAARRNRRPGRSRPTCSGRIVESGSARRRHRSCTCRRGGRVSTPQHRRGTAPVSAAIFHTSPAGTSRNSGGHHKACDQHGAGDPVDLRTFAGNPFHMQFTSNQTGASVPVAGRILPCRGAQGLPGVGAPREGLLCRGEQMQVNWPQ